MQKQQQQPKKVEPKPKKPGFYDQMWQALIRPPNRIQYSVKDLGPQHFIVQNLSATRTDFTIQNSRDQILECSYFVAKCVGKTSHPCIIYLHGNSSSRLEGLNLLEYIIPHGIALILMDFAGCGISQGEYISLGYFEKNDAGLVIDYIKKTKNITKFGIWGRSMGASTGIQIGCMRNDVSLIVSDSSFVSIQKLCQEVAKKSYKLPKFAVQLAYFLIKRKIRAKANFDLNECNTLQAIQAAKNKPSILFLASKGDTLIHYNHSIELFENYKGPKNILLFEGGHNTRRPKNILEEVSMYFRKSLLECEKGNNIEEQKSDDLFIDLKPKKSTEQLFGHQIHEKSLVSDQFSPQSDFLMIPPKFDMDDFVPQNNSSDSDKIPDENKNNKDIDISSFVLKQVNYKNNIFLSNQLEKDIFLLKQNNNSEASKGGSTSVSEFGFHEK